MLLASATLGWQRITMDNDKRRIPTATFINMLKTP